MYDFRCLNKIFKSLPAGKQVKSQINKGRAQKIRIKIIFQGYEK